MRTRVCTRAHISVSPAGARGRTLSPGFLDFSFAMTKIMRRGHLGWECIISKVAGVVGRVGRRGLYRSAWGGGRGGRWCTR